MSIFAFLVLFFFTLYQLIRLVQRNRIDVINVHYPLNNSFYFGLCRRIVPIVLVSSIHGSDIFPGVKRRVRYSRLFQFLLSSSDLIVAPSHGFKKAFLEVFPHLNGKTTVIHNGVDPAELNGLCSETTEDAQSPYILCVSNYKKHKAIDVLVQAFKLVCEAIPSAKLVIAGGGPLRGQMEDLASSMGVQDKIQFLGLIKRAELAKLLHNCDAFVLPSRFETFGIAILEAMACKKPVVATTAGGIPEIIEDGKNGILVEPDNPTALAEALVTVLRDPCLQHTLANNGYATVQERFLSEKTGSRYETIFADLLDRAKKIQGRQAVG
jgi:glycosyltransferase involved in cell wall biosynthesis